MTSNFTIADFVKVTEAFAIFPLLLVIPCYVAGWLLDLFGFRRRAWLTQFTLAIPLSFGICPIVTYLLCRWNADAMFGLYGSCLMIFVILLYHQRKRLPAMGLPYLAVCLGWVVLATLTLIDLQITDRLYFPTVTYDYALRSAVTASIGRTGVPPVNPYFFPGQPFPLRYHYFWFILCSVVQKIGGNSLSSRQAMIAGSVWCGIGLLAIVPLYLRFFQAKGRENLSLRMLIGAGLLAITGLDIFPVLLLEWKTQSQIASIEWWNDPVTAWVHAVLWVPHNIAGLIACLAAFLLLWNAASDSSVRSRPSYTIPAVVVAGLMFASAVGTTIYVTVAFGFFLAVWIIVAYVTNRRAHAVLTCCAGLVALPFAMPYLLEVFPHTSGQPASPPPVLMQGGSFPLTFAVKPFGLIDMIFQTGSSGLRANLTHLLLLPLNYFLEFGFFFAAGVFMFRKLWRRRRTLTDDQLCLPVMGASVILLCSFVRSSVIANNDLGWRGMLIAQFVLLLWGVELISEFSTLTPAKRLLVVALLFAGVTGSVYEVFKIRFYPVLSDVTSTSLNRWLSKDRSLGKRTYQLRGLYEELRRKTPESAVFENNPNTNPQDLFHGMYADRQVAAETMNCAVVFGGDPSLCRDRIGLIDDVFETPGAIAAGQIDSICNRFSINVLVVKDTDRVWQDRGSWVWHRAPMLANDYGRAYSCGSAAAGGKPVR